MTIRAFIFDLDGVITDTEEYHYQSWKRVADEEGLPFNRKDNEALRGVSRRESLNRLLKGKPVTEVQAQDYMKRKNDYFMTYLNSFSSDNRAPGLTEFLDSAYDLRLRLGVASASRNVRIVLERLQLTSYFPVVADALTIANGKPAPDPFVWVAGGLQVRMHEVVVFEDAQAGVDAARRAGCHTVGIGRSQQVEHADLRLLDGFEGVTPADILAAFEKA